MNTKTVEQPQPQRKLIHPSRRRATFVLGPHGTVADVVLYDENEALVIPVRSASVHMRPGALTSVTLEINVMGFHTEVDDGQIDALFRNS